MAITSIDYVLITQIKKMGLIPTKPAVLELGEANWYGDVDIHKLAADITAFVPDTQEQHKMLKELERLCKEQPKNWLFDIAKMFHRAFFDYSVLDAVDLTGTERAKPLNLNYPITLDRQYDVVMNLGTAEHVFNIYQFFKTVHEVTLPGGLILNVMPFTGWIDHGFYNFQPTFYFDLAAANEYTVHLISCCHVKPAKLDPLKSREDAMVLAKNGALGPNSLIYAIFGKPKEEKPFQIPHQGYYSGTLSQEAVNDWKTAR